MPEHVSILQLLGPVVLALAAVLWVTGLVRLLRRYRPANRRWAPDQPLAGLPRQRQTAPDREAVELTPAERDAFDGLVHRLNTGH
ncbi:MULTISPECIES: hypothetical protein [unclassified Streptomyces]|uniref:hypothetical protein n=1 Tax=unclassified Streptomyces TaxID=2593676 RepID=UPI00125088BE|nr:MULTISPECIES: hypothetical protein [unclassified Streptomyces]KAB2973251.1 hypothetical protein F8R89_15200 [Streptomyces sp. SS1-1]MDI9836082.1 hypothetical protein [Streptomyces sp. KAU_LT]